MLGTKINEMGTLFVSIIFSEKTLKNYYLRGTFPQNPSWTDPLYGFFGLEIYQQGDNSLKGYLVERSQTQEQRTAEEVEGVLHLLTLPVGAKILDCPCGIGRHTISLSKMGYKVTGIDINDEQIQVGIEIATKDSVIESFGQNHLTFGLGDMLDLHDLGLTTASFDAVINMFYSFGFFQTDAENEKVLSDFFKLLKPNGKFLMHTDVNLNRVREGTYKFNEERLLQKGPILYIDEVYNDQTKRIDGSWTIGAETKTYSVRVYDVEEFTLLCKKIGFTDVHVYSDWNGSLYEEKPNSEILIFVAQK